MHDFLGAIAASLPEDNAGALEQGLAVVAEEADR
jgi:hypothetical protein